eukprot:3517972-Rhodomonas_salina.1
MVSAVFGAAAVVRYIVLAKTSSEQTIFLSGPPLVPLTSLHLRTQYNNCMLRQALRKNYTCMHIPGYPGTQCTRVWQLLCSDGHIAEIWGQKYKCFECTKLPCRIVTN